MGRDHTTAGLRRVTRARVRRRIVLARHDLANAAIYHGWFNDRELHHFNCDRRFASMSLPEAIDVLKRAWVLHGSDCERYAVHLAGDGRLIGQADIYDISSDNRRARVGLEVGDKSCWGRGLGREILQALLEVAFGRMALHRVEAVIYSFNERSVRLFESAGFVREGCFRERLVRDGVAHDEYLYGLLEAEWRATGGG